MPSVQGREGRAGPSRAVHSLLLRPQSLDEALKYCNYVFTIVFVLEAVLKLVAFGFRRFFKDRCVFQGRSTSTLEDPWGSWGQASAGSARQGPGLRSAG